MTTTTPATLTTQEAAQLVRQGIAEVRVLRQMPRTADLRVLLDLTPSLQKLEEILLTVDARASEAAQLSEQLRILQHDIATATAQKTEADAQRLSAERRRDVAIANAKTEERKKVHA